MAYGQSCIGRSFSLYAQCTTAIVIGYDPSAVCRQLSHSRHQPSAISQKPSDMPLIWCSISGHGYGHAAQVVPVLNALSCLVPELKVILRTSVPGRFFQDRLACAWEISPSEQDIGCVQTDGPLVIDVDATWAEHRRFHDNWESKIAEEVHSIKAHAPDLMLSDISYLAIQAGVTANLPTVGLCTLSWDQVLAPWLGHDRAAAAWRVATIEHITKAYGHAELMIRPAPSIPLPAFRKVVDVGPVVDPQPPQRQRLRDLLQVKSDERIALVAFGGIVQKDLPFEHLDRIAGYRFLIDGSVPTGFTRLHSTGSLSLSFRTLLASCDLIVTKPGYSTIVEAVATGTPVVYVRRYNFADEQSLVEYLLRYGRGAELSLADFAAGNWEPSLDAASQAPPPPEPAPAPAGGPAAATLLAQYLR